jgi:hypothetical protein
MRLTATPSRYSDDFLDYARRLFSNMGLQSWVMVFLEDLPGDAPSIEVNYEATGYSDVYSMRREINLWFSDTIIGNTDPELTRETVVHEAIHSTFSESLNVWRCDLYETHALSLPVYHLLHHMHTRENELAVQQLAQHWAPLLPLMQDPVEQEVPDDPS